MTNAQITVFTDILETNLIEKSVVPSVARGLYNGQIVRGGVVEILGTEAVTIGQYNGTITHQTLAGSNQKVAISHAPFYSVKLDGVKDLATAPANLKAHVTKEAGKGLALDLDATLVALHSKAKVTVTGAIATVDDAFTGLATAFDLANVGMDDRGVILSPSVANKLVAKQGSALQGEKASDIVYAGYLGKYMGIEIFKSNVIGKTTTVANCIGVDMSALVLAKNYDETRDIEGVDFFGIAVQGVVSYGLDVIETETGKSNRLIAFDVDEA